MFCPLSLTKLNSFFFSLSFFLFFFYEAHSYDYPYSANIDFELTFCLFRVHYIHKHIPLSFSFMLFHLCCYFFKDIHERTFTPTRTISFGFHLSHLLAYLLILLSLHLMCAFTHIHTH